MFEAQVWSEPILPKFCNAAKDRYHDKGKNLQQLIWFRTGFVAVNEGTKNGRFERSWMSRALVSQLYQLDGKGGAVGLASLVPKNRR